MKKDFNTILRNFKRNVRKKELEWEKTRRAFQDQMAVQKHQAWMLIENCVREAAPADYLFWLAGYLATGGQPTHYYDYSIIDVMYKYYVATRDFHIAPLYGGMSINLIVPVGVTFLGGEPGHTNLFFEDGFTTSGGWVPVYQDTAFE